MEILQEILGNETQSLIMNLRQKRVEDVIGLFLYSIDFVDEKDKQSILFSDYQSAKQIIQNCSEVLDTPIVDFFIEKIKSQLIKTVANDKLLSIFATLNRVMAGAAIKYGLDGSFRCNLHNGNLILPHIAIKIPLDNTSHECQVTINNGRIKIDGENINKKIIIQLPSVDFFGKKIVLNTEDEVFIDWINNQPFHQSIVSLMESKNNLYDWQKRLYSVSLLFKKFDPEMGKNITSLITDIVPLKPTNIEGESLSCSFNNLIGAITCTLVPSEEFGEMLVHEYAHNLLNTAMLFTPLVINSGLTLEKYYSPFRLDPRPIIGVFHAMFSFVHVAEYYEKLGKDERYKNNFSELFTATVIKLRICSIVISTSGQLTDAGNRLLATMNERVEEFAKSAMWKPTSQLIIEHETHINAVGIENCDFSWLENKGLCNIVLSDTEIELSEKAIESINVKVETMPLDTALSHIFTDSLSEYPIVWKGLRIFNKNFITKDNIQEKFGSEIVKLMKLDVHKGYSTTPKFNTTLSDFLFGFSDNQEKHHYLGVQSINHWKGINEAVIPRKLLNNLFLDNEDILFFMNRAGTEVLLHQDSSNNLHFNLWGRKLFYLCHPNQSNLLHENTEGYNEGFSPINPFDDVKTEKYQTFPNVNGLYVTLEAGDCLFIPKNWWHAVKYLEDSAAVTCWDRYY